MGNESELCYVDSLTKITMQGQTPAIVVYSLIKSKAKVLFRNSLKFGFLTFYILQLACKLNFP